MKKYIVTLLLAVSLIAPHGVYAVTYLPTNQIEIVVSILRIFSLDQYKIDQIINIIKQPVMEQQEKPLGAEVKEQVKQPQPKKSNSRLPVSA